jgi:hypothetical protein
MLYRRFDIDSYDDDVQEFAEYFDHTGWPRFGEYDPCALTNPITNFPWYLAPRIPRGNEEDEEYQDWYAAAVDFNIAVDEFCECLKRIPVEIQDAHRGTGDARYKPTSLKAVHGNFAYLRKHVLPPLESLLARRKHLVQTAMLLGEFRSILAEFPLCIDHAKRHLGGIRGAKPKVAQLKWFLHVHQLNESLGKRAKTINFCLGKIVANIVDGKVPVPDGFTREWFRETQRRAKNKKGELKYSRGFSELFRRAKSDPRAARLLKSQPNEDPRIPPVDLDWYESQLNRGGT